MLKFLPYLKNKYILSSVLVLIYILILHDTDIFTLTTTNKKVADLELQIEKIKVDIEDLKVDLADLDDPRSLEKYAREHHYFKKDDEDLFIFSFE